MDKSVKPVSAKTKAPAAKNTLGWIAILIALISLGLGGYAWYQNLVESRLQTSQQASRIDALHEGLARLERAQTDAESRISQVKGAVSQAEETVANQIRVIRKEMIDQQSTIGEQLATARNMQQQQADQYREDFAGLSDSILKLGKDLGKTANNWGLEEAAQLVAVANQRLQLAGDVELAIRALTLADSRLEATGNPDVIKVRRQLSTDIEALKSVDKPDYLGTLEAIESLSVKVDQLPLPGDPETFLTKNASAPSTANATRNSAEEDQSDISADNDSDSLLNGEIFQSLVNAGKVFLADLSDLIQIEKNGEAMDPIISSEVKFMTMEKVRLTLESAQSAYLRQQFDIYQSRLLSVVSWVESRFASGDRRDEWVKEVKSLSENVPEVMLPDVSASLKALRTIIDNN